VTELLSIDGLKIDLPIASAGGNRTVVRDASLAIGEGETVGLVGESGSGKSMTARSILRLLPPGAKVGGELRFEGSEILRMTSAELRRVRRYDIAIIFQDPRSHINPVHTIGDFLIEGIRASGSEQDEAWEISSKLLAEVNIAQPDRVMAQYPHQLSGGMLQRVMIAAALTGNPRLLLADEPTTALDVTTQASVIGLLQRLRETYRLAMLFITHDLDLASAICDRTVVMYAGETVEEQESGTLMTHPLHPYAAGLSGSRPEIDRKAENLEVLPGRPLAAYEAPAGCSFAPRCKYVKQGCQKEQVLREVRDGKVRCWRAEDLQNELMTRSEANASV
jgi:oligopeptide/dipeptide ABC transporter ATP-binding protein